MKHYLSGLVIVLFTGTAPTAFAQPSPGHAQPTAFAQPTAGLTQPLEAPPPRVPSGFFLRLSLGPTYGSANDHVSVVGTERSLDLKITGTGAKFGVHLGGTPLPGLVMGGALVGNTLVDPDVEFEGQSMQATNTVLDLTSLDAFVIYYPRPGGPFHLQGSVGFGTATAEVDGTRNDASADGVVLGAGLGGDWPISTFWRAGVFGGARYAQLSNNESGVDERLTIWYPSVEVTFTYH
ncbi:MAG: hypothetical protein SFV15_03880 [Polyangiaceae bacterium]|nr:hypothetical protein [Polyangiaceae bacterium]